MRGGKDATAPGPRRFTRKQSSSSPGLLDRATGFPETLMIESKSRGVPDHPPEPVGHSADPVAADDYNSDLSGPPKRKGQRSLRHRPSLATAGPGPVPLRFHDVKLGRTWLINP